MIASAPAWAACGGKAGTATHDGSVETPPADADQSDIPAGGGDTGVDTGGNTGGDAAADQAADRDGPVDAAMMTPTEACLASLQTQCTRHVACQGGDVPSCVSMQARYCPGYYFGPASNRTVENVQACLPALAAMTCTDIAMGIVPPCLLPGKGASGDACLFPSQCQSACVNGFDQCGACAQATLAATGQACGVAAATFCGPADFCSPAKRTCVPKSSIVYADQGQPCDFDADPVVGCKGDLVCVRASAATTAGTCLPVPGAGERCADTGDIVGLMACGAGLVCDTTSMTCQALGDCGGAICDATSFCRLGAGDAGATCVPLAVEGAPCNPGGSSMAEVRCADGLTCQGASLGGPAGTCGKPGARGEACDATHYCGSALLCSSDTGGQCIGFDPSTCPVGGGATDGGTD